jgi:hypothetical protein
MDEFIRAIFHHWFVLLGGCAVTVLLGLFERWRHITIPWGWYVRILVVFLFFACFLAWNDEHASALKSIQSAFDNRAWLEPKLYIDSISSNVVRYHFEVENLGSLPAFQILKQERNENFSEANYDEPRESVLPPKGHMALGGNIFGIKTKPGVDVLTDLVLVYKSKVGGTNITLRSSFKYRISNYALKPGEFSYLRQEWIKTEDDESGKMWSAALNKPEGTTMLVWLEHKPDGSGNFTATISRDRFVVLDPTSRSVSFGSKVGNGTMHVLTGDLPSNTQRHVIALIWTTNSISLHIDGKILSDPAQ